MIVVCVKCKKPFELYPPSNVITIICSDCRYKNKK